MRAWARGDIGLVTQQNACSGAVVPSKVYGLLAAGRPILFIGPADATPAAIIHRYRCGWHIECGDVDGLVELLAQLSAQPELVRAAGQRARETLLAHYDRPLGVARICDILGLGDTVALPTIPGRQALGLPALRQTSI